jgi:predicted dehydrogenase
VAIADVADSARSAVAADVGVPGVRDYTTLIGTIDAAILATPTSTHCDIASVLLEAGVPLFVEKPLARTTEEADRLVRLAESRGLVLQVGHVERFNPALEAARPLLEDVKFISAERLSGYPARSLDVGVVLDLMIHDLDIVQTVASARVRRVDALGAAVVGPHEDVATARIEFENGCVANLTASRVSHEARRKMHFFAPTGHVAVDFAARRATASAFRGAAKAGSADMLAATLPVADLDVGECNPIADEQREFVASVAGELRPRVPGQAGRDAIALAERVLHAIEAHEWDGHPRGRIGPHALPASAILRPAAWQQADEDPLRRAAG